MVGSNWQNSMFSSKDDSAIRSSSVYSSEANLETTIAPTGVEGNDYVLVKNDQNAQSVVNAPLHIV